MGQFVGGARINECKLSQDRQNSTTTARLGLWRELVGLVTYQTKDSSTCFRVVCVTRRVTAPRNGSVTVTIGNQTAVAPATVFMYKVSSRCRRFKHCSHCATCRSLHNLKCVHTFHQLRHLRQIRRRVGREVTTRLVLVLVMSRLDYCNSLLAELPASTVNIFKESKMPLLVSSVIWNHVNMSQRRLSSFTGCQWNNECSTNCAWLCTPSTSA